MKTQTAKELIWNYLQTNPMSNARHVGQALSMSQSAATASLAMLWRERQVDRIRERDTDTEASGYPVYYYTVVGTRFRPVAEVVVPPKYSHKHKHTRETKLTKVVAALLPQLTHVAATTPVVNAPEPVHAPLTEAEEFKAWMAFKALKKAGKL